MFGSKQKVLSRLWNKTGRAASWFRRQRQLAAVSDVAVAFLGGSKLEFGPREFVTMQYSVRKAPTQKDTAATSNRMTPTEKLGSQSCLSIE